MAMMSLVVDKITGQVVFAYGVTVLVSVESLWPPAAFSYFDLQVPDQDIPDLRARPWRFAVVNGSSLLPFLVEEVQLGNYTLNAAKAKALVDLTRAVNRHRRQVVKFDLHGQDLAYAMKSEEASRFLADSNNGSFPMLYMEASVTGSTLEQVAAMVRFRATQAQEYLVESERLRRSLTIRVVQSATTEALGLVHAEIIAYARRY